MYSRNKFRFNVVKSLLKIIITCKSPTLITQNVFLTYYKGVNCKTPAPLSIQLIVSWIRCCLVYSSSLGVACSFGHSSFTWSLKNVQSLNHWNFCFRQGSKLKVYQAKQGKMNSKVWQLSDSCTCANCQHAEHS